MNKKLVSIIAIIAVIIIAVCLISLSGKDKTDSETTAPSDGQPVTIDLNEPESTTKKPFIKPSYETKTTVTLPIEIIPAEHRDNLEAYAEAQGYFYIEKVSDTHVKIKMREYSYRLLLTSIGMETVSGIGNLLDSGEYPFLLKFAKYNDDFSDVVFTVDKKKYEKAENKDIFFDLVAVYCLYYQDYDTESAGQCKITLCETGSNIVLDSRTLTEGDIK